MVAYSKTERRFYSASWGTYCLTSFVFCGAYHKELTEHICYWICCWCLVAEVLLYLTLVAEVLFYLILVTEVLLYLILVTEVWMVTCLVTSRVAVSQNSIFEFRKWKMGNWSVVPSVRTPVTPSPACPIGCPIGSLQGPVGVRLVQMVIQTGPAS